MSHLKYTNERERKLKLQLKVRHIAMMASSQRLNIITLIWRLKMSLLFLHWTVRALPKSLSIREFGIPDNVKRRYVQLPCNLRDPKWSSLPL